MHRTVLEFCQRVLTEDLITGKAVLEVGSYNHNGTVRPHCESLNPARYWGVDAAEGDGVDQVANCEQLTSHVGEDWDVVICTELLEHVQDWRSCFLELAQALKPGGTLLITTRSPGYGYHPYPEDHWRYTPDDLRRVCRVLDLVPTVLMDDPGPFGVFLMARKPMTWRPQPERLAKITMSGVEPEQSAAKLNGHTVNGQKLVVAFPLYVHLEPRFFMSWLQVDTSNVVWKTAVDGSMDLPMKMESIVNEAYRNAPDFDRLIIVEQDMIIPPDGLARMAQYQPEHDIVGSVFFKHEFPHHVMAWMQVDSPAYSPLTKDVVKTMVDNPALYEVDAVAMGFTAISRRVFDEWDRSVPMWTPAPPLNGHDLHFCNEAKKQGFKVWLDSGIGCGHLTNVPIGYEHSQAALEKVEPMTWQQARECGMDTERLEVM